MKRTSHFVKNMKQDNFDKCKVDVIFVESLDVPKRKRAWCVIGSDTGVMYKYQQQDEKDVPKLFATIKIWWIWHQEDSKKRVIKKWEVYSDDLAVDEDVQTTFDDGTDE